MKKSLIEKYTPEVWNAYLKQVEEIMKDGVLLAKYKELIAIALSIAIHCEPCIKVHIRRSIEAGATVEEIADTLGVTLMMCGGPADVWTRKIFEEEIEKLKLED